MTTLIRIPVCLVPLDTWISVATHTSDTLMTYDIATAVRLK